MTVVAFSLYWSNTVLFAQERTATRSHPIRFGVQAAPQQISWAELKEVWQEVETLGFDSLWVNDHMLPSVGPTDASNMEGWATLAAMAALTSRVKIGALVTANTFRHPAVLAKMATTIDHISNGRFMLGIGSGYFEQEHKVYGIPFPATSERAKRLEEAIQTHLPPAEPEVCL